MDKYILVPWPESQELMEEEWFDKCILGDNSSYFVPEKYLVTAVECAQAIRRNGIYNIETGEIEPTVNEEFTELEKLLIKKYDNWSNACMTLQDYADDGDIKGLIKIFADIRDEELAELEIKYDTLYDEVLELRHTKTG